ncbi:conserved hypothetical protein, secreted [Candidatus Magnetomorum sp. HK-1]|nr:conserved hypothetical protein, secreted [Candidatus Magnetomorum sp. HK-1]
MKISVTSYLTLIFFVLFFHTFSSCSYNKYQICNEKYCKTKGIFRENEWYCHYECALSCIQGGCYDQALICLNNAEKLKKDNTDRKMVRTYAMHFVDYFLHREKGIIFYRTGKYKQALKELSLSISHEPSERAYTYLDKTRSKIFIQNRLAETTPQISINGIADYDKIIWTNKKKISISGIVSDEQYVSAIIIQQKSLFIQSSNKIIPFYNEFILPEGKQPVVIKAMNIMKNEAEKTITFFVDRSGPLIQIHKISNNIFKGIVSDESGEITFQVNNYSTQIIKEKSYFFSIPFDPNAKFLKYKAKDKLGNKTTGNLSLIKNRHLVAFNSSTISDIPLLTIGNGSPPKLELNHIKSSNVNAYRDNIEISGFVEYNQKIKSFFINKKKINKTPVIKMDFNQSIMLKKGLNEILFELHYDSNAILSKTIKIERKIQKIYQTAQRRSLYFRKVENTDSENFIFQKLLIKKLKKTNRFKIIAFSNSNCIIVDLPRIISHNIKLDDPEKELEALIQIENLKGEVLSNIDAYCDVSGKGRSYQLKFLAERIVEHIIRKYPLIDGSLKIESNSQFVVTPDKIIPDEILIKFKNKSIKCDEIIQPGNGVILYKKDDLDCTFGCETKIVGNSSVKGIYSFKYSINPIHLQNHFENIRGINQ